MNSKFTVFLTKICASYQIVIKRVLSIKKCRIFSVITNIII